MNIERSILNEFPYPIAKCYEKVVSAHGLFERWEKLRYLFEVTLKYLSCLSISSYLKTNREDAQINTALKYLIRPTLGHWFNLFSLTLKYHHSKDNDIFPKDICEKIRDREDLISGVNAIKNFLEPGKRAAAETTTLVQSLETMVAYRNRTAGHGAPQTDHLEEFVPLLERATVDLLLHLQFIRRIPLLYLSEIKVERTSFIHVLFRLMGTTKVLLKDFTTNKDSSLIGFDKHIFMGNVDSEVPSLSLHPLLILSKDEVYLLQSSDLRHNVEYICHHTGDVFSADRVYEDFKDTFGTYLLEKSDLPSGGDSEEVYATVLRLSLVDGVIEEEEKERLLEVARQLGIPERRAKEIEEQQKLMLSKEITPEEKTVGQIHGKGTLAARNQRPDNEYTHILFFPYASVRIGFWADIVSRIASIAHKRGMIFSMVAPDPQADHDAAFMTALLSDFDHIINMHDPQIIIMAPSPSKAFVDLLGRYLDRTTVPLMTIDTEFNNYDVFAEKNIPYPPSVQLDNPAGGELAADILLGNIQSPAEGRTQVLIMPGLEDAPHSISRVEAFTRRVRILCPDSKIRILSPGGFSKKRARMIFADFLEDADITKYQGIFCCDDEMALGVYGHLCSTLLHAPKSAFKIVGFNNTPEMQATIENDMTGFLAGSIDQNLASYVDKIFEVADMLLTGEKVDRRYLISPQSVKPKQ